MKQNKRVKWGILGTSYISEVMAKAIKESSDGELIAIASRCLNNAKHFADKFLIANFYSDYHSLLNNPDIDAIYIGLPNHLHKDWIIHCAQSGKHILCEKPFVLTGDEAREAIAIVQKENVFCMEGLMYRCHPFTKKLQALIQSNILGDIKLYHATYTANIADIANPIAGGSIRNLGCYPISLIRLLANAEPIAIQAIGRLSDKNPNDSQASAILKFENNAIAVVSTADDIEMCWQFDVYGTKGHLKIMTNPWLPDDNNKCLISLNDQSIPSEIKVTADKFLYTYQIDTMNQQITDHNYTAHDGISLQDSLGNVTVLEKWQQLVI